MNTICNKKKVSIEYINWLLEERAKINSMNLKDIEFSENTKVLDIDPMIIEEFNYTGLCNIDFITSGFYKEFPHKAYLKPETKVRDLCTKEDK